MIQWLKQTAKLFMLQYAIQRTLLAVPTLIGITLISFLVMRLAPGDPVDLFLGGAAGGEGISTDRQADLEKTRQELRRQLGLDQPLHKQYFSWLFDLILKVEALDEFERGAILADKVLAGLSAVQCSTLVGMEVEEQKKQLLV